MQSFPLLKDILKDNNCITGEGYIIGTNGSLIKDYIYNYPTLPTNGVSAKGINYNKLEIIENKIKFVQIPNETLFKAPNIILWENIGIDKLPVFYNQKSFSFKDKIVSIATPNADKTILKEISESFEKYSRFYRFYIFATSSQVLVNLNTAILKKDYMSLRFIFKENFLSDLISCFDQNIISDVNDFFENFLRHGEKSKALREIKSNKLETIISSYGLEFSKALNTIYENDERKFRLSDVIQLENSLIATIFKYDSENVEPKFAKDLSELNIDGLTNNQISAHLSVNRIIKLYPQKDTIVFIKPNQYRYWISLIAYRDADKCFSDFSNAGF